eukprot:SAG11_NODE_4104_length_2063_cov_1.708248_1_plen_91_part_00
MGAALCGTVLQFVLLSVIACTTSSPPCLHFRPADRAEYVRACCVEAHAAHLIDSFGWLNRAARAAFLLSSPPAALPPNLAARCTAPCFRG